MGINIKMKLLSNLTLVGLITAAPSMPKDQADPVNMIKEAESMRQTTMRVNIQHWEMGVAASDSIAQRFLDRTDNGPATMSQRSFDHSLLRFKLLMGMMVWSHQSLGIKFHNNLPELGFHLTHEELLAGIGFDNNIENSITCRDAEGTCARRTCECDKHFAIHAAEHFYQWDENNHGLDFDRSTQCAPREGNGAQFENDCQREAHRTDIVEGLIPMKRPKEHTTKTSAVPATTTTLKTTTTTTATTTTTTTTTTKDEHWHTHPDVPQGHVHVTRPRKN